MDTVRRVGWDLNDHPPCNCPICKIYTIREMIDVPHRIWNHNVYIIESKARHFEITVKDYNEFMRALQQEACHFNQYKIKHLDSTIDAILDLLY